MSEPLTAEIVELEPLHVAVASGFGQEPELTAWAKAITWADGQGLLDSLETVRFFGHNNPDPSPGSPNYGYDQWLTVAEGTAGTDDIAIKAFPGGLYAVTECTGPQNLPATWKALVTWLEDSAYQHGAHQWLEELLNFAEVFRAPDGTWQTQDIPHQKMHFRIYLPISKLG